MSDTDKQQQYERWVEVYADQLFRFAYRLCGSRETADDLTQETFYHAWRSYDSLKEPGRARAWLYQILRFRYSHWVRADRRRPTLVSPAENAPPPPDENAEPTIDRLVREETVQRALDELDERYRVPMLLVFMEGMTCQQAADQLKVPLGTVLSRIHRARKHLRERLGDDDPAGSTNTSGQTNAGSTGEARRRGHA